MSVEMDKADRPFALLSYVARTFLQMSSDDWKSLSDEDRKSYAQAANRALNAAKKFKENQDAAAAA